MYNIMRRKKEDTKEHNVMMQLTCRDCRLSFLLFYNYTNFGYIYSPTTVLAYDYYAI